MCTYRHAQYEIYKHTKQCPVVWCNYTARAMKVHIKINFRP